MRKNAGLKSKEEMEKFLRDGGLLYHMGCKLYFDKEKLFLGEYPYVLEYPDGRKESISGLWDFYNEMEIESPWEDELENRKILCWVSDMEQDEKCVALLVNNYRGSYYLTTSTGEWKYATPVTEEESKRFIL